jgi:short chain dehydrogenase
MSKTILITGSSSGIGRATAKHFQAKGWNVVATMRKPEIETELDKFQNVLVTRLDVQEPATIEDAIQKGIKRFGTIDVLLNNAGYGAYGVLEAAPIENIRRQFDVNVIGLGCKMKIVEPGAIKTDFAGRSFDFMNDESLIEYREVVQKLMGAIGALLQNASEPGVVAEVIYQAATDGTNQLRYTAGEDAKVLVAQRKQADDATFIGGIKRQFGL